MKRLLIPFRNVVFIPLPRSGNIFSKENSLMFPKNKINILNTTKGIINRLLLYKALYFRLHTKKAQIKKVKIIKKVGVFG